ncbi:class I adenylate-forming enzyme family protein [Kitasatospora cineracea]|uniref:Acyl-CoA synthetase (AMP-forming)/AMP-acid ligase II n=1 Tax=Kitasatospora cineracea TaxID=88074 RepID=A0A8G1UHM4_9ACTN|nr:AMP-binding protein [Kitasatospora cineracea]ROR43214.1 acyl-CoA synthetase (AMP-forming)/AMP-acid ligase II [Kitasatospora cineracea]
MTDDRGALAALVLSAGSRVDGRPVGGADGLVDRARAALDGAGVRPGDVVLLTDLEPGALVAATVAAWQLDAVPLVAPNDRNLPAGLRGTCRLRHGLEAVPATGARTAPGLERTAVLMPTSGSTGTPKPARRGVAGVLVEAAGYQGYLGLTAADLVAVPVPLTHSYGWGVAMSALLAGCDLDTTPPTRPMALAGLLDTGTVAVVALTAGIARLLVDTRRTGEGRVRAALAGAGPVPDALDAAFRGRFGRPLERGYGSTETGGVFLGPRGIGRPIDGITVSSPPAGERGELVLATRVPVEGLLGSEPTRLWRTGDLVERDADGIFHHVRRLGSALRVNGRWVDPDEVTRGLGALPGVTEVHLLVLGRERTPGIEDLHAVVETSAAVPAAAVEDRLSALPAGVPRPRVLLCPSVPRNVVGKLDRDALIALVRQEEHRAK